MTPLDTTVPVAGTAWPDRVWVRIDRVLTVVGLVGVFRRDCALAVVVALGMLGVLGLTTIDPELALDGLAADDFAVALAAVAVQCLLLCLRRVAPTTTLVLVVLAQIAMTVLMPPGGAVHGPALLIAAYTCAIVLRFRRVVWLTTTALVVELAVHAVVNALAEPPPALHTYLSLLTAQILNLALSYYGGVLLGVHVATRRRYLELVQLRAHEAVATQQDRVRAAIGQERSRMARELHDLAAHHLSGMVVQAGVVEKLVDRDPERARATAAWVRQQGRRTLHDLRLVVGALREPGQDDDVSGTVPGLAQLDQLVDIARDLGTPITVERHGSAELPPIADITVHRVAQEALSNARDHAPGAPVHVLVDIRDGEVVLEVVNGPSVGGGKLAADSRGFGLMGMRERAQLVGATLHAGATPDGGWRVRLAVPYEGVSSE